MFASPKPMFWHFGEVNSISSSINLIFTCLCCAWMLSHFNFCRWMILLGEKTSTLVRIYVDFLNTFTKQHIFIAVYALHILFLRLFHSHRNNLLFFNLFNCVSFLTPLTCSFLLCDRFLPVNSCLVSRWYFWIFTCSSCLDRHITLCFQIVFCLVTCLVVTLVAEWTILSL